MSTHELKAWPHYFEAIIDGRKTFEARRKDGREFHVGDRLWLREHDGHNFTGRVTFRRVTFVLDGDDDLGSMLAEGVVVMALGADA